MYKIALVGLGGFFGTVARYLVGQSLGGTFAPFPFPTFIINIIGCFVIGMIYGVSGRFDWLTPDMKLFLTVGFCGGFTTFSSFANENIMLLDQKEYALFFLYTIGSVAIGLLSVWAGLLIAKA